jgi:hypothetical protein
MTAVPNARQRIADELRKKMHRPTDGTADPARQAERVHEDARRAEHEAQVAAASQAQQAATPESRRMAPNPAQGSSHAGGVIEAPPTGTTPAERIRAITRAKFDGAQLAPHQQ